MNGLTTIHMHKNICVNIDRTHVDRVCVLIMRMCSKSYDKIVCMLYVYESRSAIAQHSETCTTMHSFVLATWRNATRKRSHFCESIITLPLKSNVSIRECPAIKSQSVQIIQQETSIIRT